MRNRWVLSWLPPIIALLFAAGDTARAAESKSNWDNLKTLRAGEDTRFTLHDGKSYRGSFQSVNEAGITVRLATSEQTFAKVNVARVSIKSQGHRARNALIGVLVGTGAG